MATNQALASAEERTHPARTTAIALAAALGLGLASAARMLLLYERITVRDAVLSGLMDWGTWLPFVPLVLFLQRRLPLSGERRAARIALHVLFAALVAFGQALVFARATAAVRGTELALELRSAILIKLHAGVFLYFVLVLGLESLAAQRRAREEAARREVIGRHLAEARFVALEGHLRPHFLFNTLNSIAAHAHFDADRAEALISKLGGLLRRTISDGEAEVTLAGELDFVRDYLDIEHARFGERLEYEVVAEPGCEAALLPRLALQPLVENAVQHGIAPRIDGGRVVVRAGREGGSLCVRVANTGEPARDEQRARGEDLEPSRPTGSGFALTAVRERLQGLYGERGRLELRVEPVGTTLVELRVPFHTAAGSSARASVGLA